MRYPCRITRLFATGSSQHSLTSRKCWIRSAPRGAANRGEGFSGKIETEARREPCRSGPAEYPSRGLISLGIAILLATAAVAAPSAPLYGNNSTTNASPDSLNPSAALQQLRKCIARKNAPCASAALKQIDDAKLTNDADYFDLKAEALSLARRYKPALAAVQRAIQLNPHRADFLLTQGRIDQQIGNQPAAIQSFLYAEQLQPGAEAPVYYLGMSFFMLGYNNNDNADYDRAARHFRIALELNSRDDRAQFMLGVVNSIEFKVTEARKDFEEALKMNPDNVYYHLHYGMLLNQTGHLADAERQMEMAERLDPSYARTYLSLGDVEAQMGRYHQARVQLETAVRLDPLLSSAYYTLGRVYYRLGLREKSRETLRKFQEMKRQEQTATDPMGAPIGAATSQTQSR